ncbi:MAG: hypothetical protein OXF79_11765 [Chloroflexi bacterium]|nr:hypothetical protein [Chloroflexota bacterium]
MATMSAGRIAKAALWMLPSCILETAVLQVTAQAPGTELSLSTAIAVTAFTILFQVFRMTPGGYCHPPKNREIYEKISTDYQEIAKLTNVIRDGQPFLAVKIWLLCEAGSHVRLCGPSRTLRAFTAGPTVGTYFPDSAKIFGSATFLDYPIENVILGRREAENYTDAQKRQAVNKGMLRILYHCLKFYMIIGQDRISSRLIDEARAVYVCEVVDRAYPNSLAAVAQAREGNFGRQGTVDIPLREAMYQARQPADNGNAAALKTATNEVSSASTPCSTWPP